MKTQYFILLPFLFLLQACQFGCPDDKTLINEAIANLASGESILPMTWTSDEKFFNENYAEQHAFSNGNGELRYRPSFQMQYTLMKSQERLMSSSFAAVGINHTNVAPESVQPYPGDMPSANGASYLVRMRLDSGPAFIKATVLYFDGCPRIRWLLWEPNSWKIHVEQRFRQYWEGKGRSLD